MQEFPIAPTSEGYSVLVSPADPDGFLAAVQRVQRVR